MSVILRCCVDEDHHTHIPSLHSEPDEMIYDDVELGEEGGCSSSLDNGWSSSEFESYEEASDGEGRSENGLPHAFMRGKPAQRKTHVSDRDHRLQLAQVSESRFHICTYDLNPVVHSPPPVSDQRSSQLPALSAGLASGFESLASSDSRGFLGEVSHSYFPFWCLRMRQICKI